MVRIAAMALLCACVANPRGRCATDADCKGGPPGSFCAESICQGLPRGTVDALGGRTFARADTMHVRIRVQHSHGTATARVLFNGNAVAAQNLPDGTLAADVPLVLAPAGVEGAVPFSVELSDSLGHVVALPSSVLVDDLAPRLSIDPASVPASAVLRGVPVSLRVTVEDLSPVTVTGSFGLPRVEIGATRNSDGSFNLPVDTRTAPPGASTLELAVVATDAVGNTSTAHAAIALTRLKFIAPHPGSGSVNSLVLDDSRIWGLVNQGEIWIVRRSDGASLLRSSTSSTVFPQLATDGSRLFFSRFDRRLCRMGADGVLQLCQDSNAALTSGPILQGTLAIAASGAGTAVESSRFIGMLDDPFGTLTYSNPLANFASNMPATGPDGNVYAGAEQKIAAAHPTALNWTASHPTPEPSTYYGGQPAFRGTQVLVTTSAATLDTFSFTDPLLVDAPPPTTKQVANVGVSLFSPTIAADGTAIVATSDRHLVALFPDNSIRWSILLNDPPTAPPTNGAGDLIYVGTVRGDILALSLADGATVWKYAAPSPISGPLAPGCDGILYAATDGAILALVLDAPGLANSSWPMASHDVRGSGDARRPLRSAAGACLE